MQQMNRMRTMTGGHRLVPVTTSADGLPWLACGDFGDVFGGVFAGERCDMCGWTCPRARRLAPAGPTRRLREIITMRPLPGCTSLPGDDQSVRVGARAGSWTRRLRAAEQQLEEGREWGLTETEGL